MDAKIASRCGCGKNYTHDDWKKLPCIGIQQALSPKDNLELRNCSCGSTLSVPVKDLKKNITEKINKLLKKSKMK